MRQSRTALWSPSSERATSGPVLRNLRRPPWRAHARAVLGEFAGTTVLLFVEVLLVRWLFGPRSALALGLPEFVARLSLVALVTGIVVGLLIASRVGRSSGGHFNPAVTATFWFLRGLPGVDAAAF